MIHRVNRLKKKLGKKVQVICFKKELLEKIDSYLERKEVIIEGGENHLVFKVSNQVLKIVVEKNQISYQEQKGSTTFSSRYHTYENGYGICYEEESKISFDLKERYLHERRNRKVFKFYDKKKIEKFRRETKIVENYYEDKKTRELTLHEPNVLENYIENIYTWRMEGYVLQRKITQYRYPEGVDELIDSIGKDYCLLRYQKVDEKSKEIPDWGKYYSIDQEVFFGYFQKKNTMDEVIKNYHNKNYVRTFSMKF